MSKELEDIKKIGIPSEELFHEVVDELLEYKQLEEKIGCPLKVLSAVLENGFYYDYGYIPPYRINRIDIFKKEIMYQDEEINFFTVKLKDYKKTWWLKPDRSDLICQ